VRAAYPDLDAANVINRILATATPVGSTVPDPLYGFGIVNAYDALVAEVPLVNTNPLGSLDEWIVLHRKQEGNPIVVPLGPPRAQDQGVATSPHGIPLVADTENSLLPYLVTGGFAAALVGVILAFVVVVSVSRKPID
jgi:hypothetical protein